MGHFVEGNSRDVQHSAYDVTMLNYVSSLIVVMGHGDEANISIIIVGVFLIVIN